MTTFQWNLPRISWELGRAPKLMGIVNVTPDSFSDGGTSLDRDAAVQHAVSLVEAGADLLDIGGESTRPAAESVPTEQELRRVIPVVTELANLTTVPISIDTTKAEVARQAIAAGAQIVNDISGLTWDPQMPALCAESACGVICMHIQGTPQTMQTDPHYDHVVSNICTHLSERMESLAAQGIKREALVLDPGIGFGKTARHNLQILAHVGRFRALGRPVCIGHSRKRFLGKLLERPIDEREFGTVGVSFALAMQSVDILRLHDVAATRDCLAAWHAVKGALDEDSENFNAFPS